MVLISHANISTETTHKRNWSVVLLISWKPWLRAQVIPGSCINLTSNLLIEMSLYHIPFIVIFLQSFTASDGSAQWQAEEVNTCTCRTGHQHVSGKWDSRRWLKILDAKSTRSYSIHSGHDSTDTITRQPMRAWELDLTFRSWVPQFLSASHSPNAPNPLKSDRQPMRAHTDSLAYLPMGVHTDRLEPNTYKNCQTPPEKSPQHKGFTWLTELVQRCPTQTTNNL